VVPGGVDARGGHRLSAALYDPLTRRAERRRLGAWRAALLAGARGDLLEIGAGTGANLPHLPPAVRGAVLCEPDPAMRRRLAARVAASGRAGLRVDPSPAEDLGAPDASVDTLVATLVLCSVADPARALAEARRVLRPGGRLLFLEHVRGPGWRGRAQDAVTPAWRRVAGGCHPNRDSVGALRAAGLVVERLALTSDVPWGPLGAPVAMGVARRRG